MEVLRARTAGFCMGVSLALRKLDEALERRRGAGRICTLGPIIHNPQVLEDYRLKGVTRIECGDGLLARDTVLIRAHGVTREEEQRIRSCGASVDDATCPRVKRAQLAIGRATGAGSTLLLFGEPEHPEVRGLVSYARAQARVFSSLKELERLDPDPRLPYVLASQTTQDGESFAAIEDMLQSRLKHLFVLRTICDATGRRQAEAIKIAEEVDAMVVVGGRQSGNTRRLAGIAEKAGVPTFLVERPEELPREFFAAQRRVGLTAGASTPKTLIDATEAWLKGFPDQVLDNYRTYS